jgi:hypothetical protein
MILCLPWFLIIDGDHIQEQHVFHIINEGDHEASKLLQSVTKKALWFVAQVVRFVLQILKAILGVFFFRTQYPLSRTCPVLCSVCTAVKKDGRFCLLTPAIPIAFATKNDW